MTCSPARLAANRRNAQLSTGPRTPEGKERSRANSLKHGLCSATVVPEDLEALQERTTEWFFALKPQNDYQGWVVDKIATISLRIDRAERMERRYRDRRSLKAELAWDDDARLEAERLGGKLAQRPAEIVEELRRTPCGCDWLISRWSMLAHAADVNANHTWTEDQAAMAFALLGTPAEFRHGRQPGDALDEHGRVIEPSGDQAALARREVDALLLRRLEVAPMDEVDRALTESDLFDESHPSLKNLRRYEGTLHNRLRFFLSEMKYESPHFKPDAELTRNKIVFRAPPAEPEPTPAQQAGLPVVHSKLDRNAPWDVTSPHPPFDLEAHEVPADGSKANPFQVLLSRQEQREKKAEQRREAKRRKAEKLRG